MFDTIIALLMSIRDFFQKQHKNPTNPQIWMFVYVYVFIFI